MAVRTDFAAGEVLAAQDLDDTFASKPPFAYGTATPTTTVKGFIWYDENSTPPLVKFWNGSAFKNFAKPVGLVHINTTTFTTQSSVSLDNLFTSDYLNYKLIYSGASSADGELRFRMRAAGADNSASSYSNQAFNLDSSTIQSGKSTQNYGGFATGGTAQQQSVAELFRPFTAQNTGIQISGTRSQNNPIIRLDWTAHTVASSFDGITVFTSTGTFTGKISVYGYSEGI